MLQRAVIPPAPRAFLAAAFLLAVTAATAAAQSPPPLYDWQHDWKAACDRSAADGKPILVCVMKDGEVGCTRMLEGVYTDPEVRLRLANFILVPASKATHDLVDIDRNGETVKSCPQFRGVLCSEHQALERELREKLVEPGQEEVVAPQHVVLAADGALILRREYEMKRQGFLEFLDRGLGQVKEPGADVNVVRSPVVAKLLDAIMKAKNEEEREAAARELLSDSSPEREIALREAVARLKSAEDKGIVVRAAGYADCAVWAPVIAQLLAEKNTHVRNCAVVTLEEEANPVVADALLALWAKEKDAEIKKDLLRAFGPVCHGRKEARDILLAELASTKENHRVACGLSLGHFLKGDAEVAKALELRYAKEKSGMVQIAILWGIGQSGDPSQHLLLETMIKDEKNDNLLQLAETVKDRLNGTGPDALRGAGAGGGGGGAGGGAGAGGGTNPGGGAGAGGGAGGAGGIPGGGARGAAGAIPPWAGMRSMRLLGPLYAGDEIVRNVLRAFQDRGAGNGRGAGNNGGKSGKSGN